MESSSSSIGAPPNPQRHVGACSVRLPVGEFDRCNNKHLNRNTRAGLPSAAGNFIMLVFDQLKVSRSNVAPLMRT